MTIMEAVRQVDVLKPNAYSIRQKIQWLSQLEAMVYRLVLGKTEAGDFPGFGDETDTDTVLAMPAPFDMAYLYWLEAQIHYANEDMDLYNRAIVQFNGIYAEFKAAYKRSHRARAVGRFRF